MNDFFPKKAVSALNILSALKSFTQSRGEDPALRQMCTQIFYGIFSCAVHQIKLFHLELFDDIGGLFQTCFVGIFQMQSADNGFHGKFGKYLVTEKQSVDDTGVTAAGHKHTVRAQQGLFLGDDILFGAFLVVEEIPAALFRGDPRNGTGEKNPVADVVKQIDGSHF